MMVEEQPQIKAAAEEKQEEEGALDLSLKKGGPENNRLNPATAAPAIATQLTIFYSGSVSVYDAVAPEKAQAIMLIAAASAAAASNKNPTTDPLSTTAVASPVLMRSPSLQSSCAVVTAAAAAQPTPQLLPNSSSSLCKLQAELPIARRYSLQRFLEKRRDRLVTKTPYASPDARTSQGMEEAEVEEGKHKVSSAS